MWPFSKKTVFFSHEEEEIIVQSIRDAEKQTSGEVRVFVESHCRFIEPLDRAAEIFDNLEMENTAHRNGVLFYAALKDRQLAVFADSGIHKAMGEQYWKDIVRDILVFLIKKIIRRVLKNAFQK